MFRATCLVNCPSVTRPAAFGPLLRLKSLPLLQLLYSPLPAFFPATFPSFSSITSIPRRLQPAIPQPFPCRFPCWHFPPPSPLTHPLLCTQSQPDRYRLSSAADVLCPCDLSVCVPPMPAAVEQARKVCLICGPMTPSQVRRHSPVLAARHPLPGCC